MNNKKSFLNYLETQNYYYLYHCMTLYSIQSLSQVLKERDFLELFLSFCILQNKTLILIQIYILISLLIFHYFLILYLFLIEFGFYLNFLFLQIYLNILCYHIFFLLVF